MADAGIVELVKAGPFGGIDPTSDEFDLAPAMFRDALNFAPNLNFGGLQTVKGRQQLTTIATIMGLTGVCTGMTIFHRQTLPEVFLYAVTVNNQGYLVATDSAGHPIILTNAPTNWTPNRPTFFAQAGKWCFVTNGVDVPLKIDQNLNVTLWGIGAPSTAPTLAAGALGNLAGEYWYACTFGNADQESSQGVISAPITTQQATALGTISVSGTPTAGDIVSVYVLGPTTQAYASYTVKTGDHSQDVAANLAGAIANNPAMAQFVWASSDLNNITLHASFPGAASNGIQFYGSVTGTTIISPTTATNLSGGADGTAVVLTGIPQPLDPQITAINLYRIGGSLGQWRLIATLTPGTTTYTDNLADSAVTGQSLTIFRDPPPAFRYIAAHQGRIMGFGTSADPSQLWFSNYNEPWGFNPVSNTRPVGENNFGDGAVAMASLGSTLMLFKRRSCYTLVGSTDADFDVYPLFEIGCASAFSVAVLEGTVFWESNQSVWAYNGYSRENISDGAYQKSNIKAIFDSLNPTERAQACGFIYDHGYYLSLPTRGKTYLYDIRSQSWWPLGFAASVACADLEDPDHDPLVIGVGPDGTVAQWFATSNDLEADMPAYVVTGIQDSGDIRSTKTYDSFRLRAPIQSQGIKATVTLFVNPDSPLQTFDAQTVVLDGTTGGGYAVQQQALKMLKGYCAQARIDVVAQNQEPVLISKLAVFGRIDRELVELG